MENIAPVHERQKEVLACFTHPVPQGCDHQLLTLKMLVNENFGRTQSKKWKYSLSNSLFKALNMLSAALNLPSSHWSVKNSLRASHCVHICLTIGGERASGSEMASGVYEAQHDRIPEILLPVPHAWHCF